jgi:hypothetical protein
LYSHIAWIGFSEQFAWICMCSWMCRASMNNKQE